MPRPAAPAFTNLLLAQRVSHLSKSNQQDPFSALYFWSDLSSARCPALAVRMLSNTCSASPPTPQSLVFSCPVRSLLVITYMQLPPLLLHDQLLPLTCHTKRLYCTEQTGSPVCASPATSSNLRIPQAASARLICG